MVRYSNLPDGFLEECLEFAKQNPIALLNASIYFREAFGGINENCYFFSIVNANLNFTIRTIGFPSEPQYRDIGWFFTTEEFYRQNQRCALRDLEKHMELFHSLFKVFYLFNLDCFNNFWYAEVV